jgi:hypothetical protein
MTFATHAFERSFRKPVRLDPTIESLLSECRSDSCGLFEITINFPACSTETLHHFQWSSIYNQLIEPEILAQLAGLTVRIPCAVHNASRVQATIENKLPRLSALNLLLVECIPLA